MQVESNVIEEHDFFLKNVCEKKNEKAKKHKNECFEIEILVCVLNIRDGLHKSTIGINAVPWW